MFRASKNKAKACVVKAKQVKQKNVQSKSEERLTNTIITNKNSEISLQSSPFTTTRRNQTTLIDDTPIITQKKFKRKKQQKKFDFDPSSLSHSSLPLFNSFPTFTQTSLLLHRTGARSYLSFASQLSGCDHSSRKKRQNHILPPSLPFQHISQSTIDSSINRLTSRLSLPAHPLIPSVNDINTVSTLSTRHINSLSPHYHPQSPQQLEYNSCVTMDSFKPTHISSETLSDHFSPSSTSSPLSSTILTSNVQEHPKRLPTVAEQSKLRQPSKLMQIALKKQLQQQNQQSRSFSAQQKVVNNRDGEPGNL
jgi:hypothetical protein